MTASVPTIACVSDHCITCADEGIPMTVTAIDECRGLALCREQGGASATVEMALVAPVAVGDRLLVHAGTAIAILAAGIAGGAGRGA